MTDVFRRVTTGAVISPGGQRSAVRAGLTVEVGVPVARHAALARTPLGGRVEPRAERGEHRLVPHRLAHVEQEGRVRDDARLGRRGEAAGEQLLEVHRGLVGLGDRHGDLDPAVLPGDRSLRLALDRDLASGARLHLGRQRPHVEAG